jgi:hypothetical protein
VPAPGFATIVLTSAILGDRIEAGSYNTEIRRWGDDLHHYLVDLPEYLVDAYVARTPGCERLDDFRRRLGIAADE